MNDPKPQMPRMPWYPRDFRSSTLGWSLVARAVYRELLDAQWDVSGLPVDPEDLRAIAQASLAEWKKAWRHVEAKFPVDADGKRRNPRLELHRADALQLAAKRRKAAKKRWSGRKENVVPFSSGGDEA